MKPRNPLHQKVLAYLEKNPKLQSTAAINLALKHSHRQQNKTVARWLSLQFEAKRIQRHAVGSQFYYSLLGQIITRQDIENIVPINFILRNLDIKAKAEPVKVKVVQGPPQTVEEFFAAGGERTVLPGINFDRPDLRRRPI